MENKALLPTEKAHEPNEEARHPQQYRRNVMSPPIEEIPSKKFIQFSDNTDTTGKSSSLKNSSYKDVLSQPAPGLSHRQRLLWLQKRREAGLWVQCDECDRWRYLPDVLDSHELPKKWYCRMNPDAAVASCSAPEAPIRICEEEDLIHGEYSAGSVVWARLAGWPRWPAMVDDCPDTEQFYWLDGFSDIPTHYHVVFFDASDVTRAWISPGQLTPYNPCKNIFNHLVKDKKYKKRLDAAVTQADDAVRLPLYDRLAKYSFIARYKGNVTSPKKINRKHLRKYRNQLKRKFDVEFGTASESDDDNCSQTIIKQNVILLGTPKKTAAPNLKPRKVISEDVVDNSWKHQDSLLTNGNDIIMNADTSKSDTKQLNSMAVQVGSTVDTAVETTSMDNDTSKTYVPEEVSEPTETESTYPESNDIQVRIASPTSDDFDF